VKKLSKEEWNELIEKDKAYGKIVCRCEMVTEGQVRDACNRSVPASSTDGIKRRVRAGMGRCQGGFCLPRVMEIVAECTDGSMEKVQKAGAESVYITGKNKEDLDGVR
jgi:glycerol-3-phosphate dehydrogenase